MIKTSLDSNSSVGEVIINDKLELKIFESGKIGVGFKLNPNFDFVLLFSISLYELDEIVKNVNDWVVCRQYKKSFEDLKL